MTKVTWQMRKAVLIIVTLLSPHRSATFLDSLYRQFRIWDPLNDFSLSRQGGSGQQQQQQQQTDNHFVRHNLDGQRSQEKFSQLLSNDKFGSSDEPDFSNDAINSLNDISNSNNYYHHGHPLNHLEQRQDGFGGFGGLQAGGFGVPPGQGLFIAAAILIVIGGGIIVVAWFLGPGLPATTTTTTSAPATTTTTTTTTTTPA